MASIEQPTPSSSAMAGTSRSKMARMLSSFACEGVLRSMVKTTLPGSTLRELGVKIIWPTPATAPGW
jgi:hypothetical protein